MVYRLTMINDMSIRGVSTKWMYERAKKCPMIEKNP